MRKNPRRSAVSEILKPPLPAPTVTPCSKSLRSRFFSILMRNLNNNWSSWPCLHVFMNWVAAKWLADEIFALTSRCAGVPYKVATECIKICLSQKHDTTIKVINIWVEKCRDICMSLLLRPSLYTARCVQFKFEVTKREVCAYKTYNTCAKQAKQLPRSKRGIQWIHLGFRNLSFGPGQPSLQAFTQGLGFS